MRRRLPWIVLPIVLGLGAPATHTDDGWPGFRGPGSDGRVPGGRLFSGTDTALRIGWKRAIGPGYSAVAVSDGRVFTMFAAGEDDVLAAFDTETGDELWRYRIAKTHRGPSGSHDGPISTPLTVNGTVFGLGPEGELFALRADSGRQLWQKHLSHDLGAEKPSYGFATSPALVDGVLIIQIGIKGGAAIAGLDPKDGSLRWKTGEGIVEYHSPIVATLDGQRQVIAATQQNVYGLDPRNGKVLWSHRHKGDGRPIGGRTIVPVPAGEGRLFLMNEADSSVMLQVSQRNSSWNVESLWTRETLKGSYVTPVYHDGYLYGMSNRIFTCIDAATGEIRWRSRQPGDGFPTVVGDRLVILTKSGSLSVAEASPDDYRELTRIQLFDEHSWSEVAFAGGSLFARGMGQLARIDPTAGAASGTSDSDWIDRTAFGRFLGDLEQAQDRIAEVEAWLARQDSFPVVERNGAVHFIYRGDAEDVGIVGDMIGSRREEPMTRVEGTDLFYYSTRLEPDAAVSYGFIVDYADAEPDRLNPYDEDALFGEVSWFAMPAWLPPAYDPRATVQDAGRLETIEWISEARGNRRKAQVYLPAGYGTRGDRRYPVAVVHDGKAALEKGALKQALDQLLGATVEPLIGVFVWADPDESRADRRHRDAYATMIAEELVPLIDERYRTIAKREARASIGSGNAANLALYGVFTRPGAFGRVGSQSSTLYGRPLASKLGSADSNPLVIYLEWGTYHQRRPDEAWDLVEDHRALWRQLRQAGYRPSGGEVPEGFGWRCWQGRVDDMLRTLFPIRR